MKATFKFGLVSASAAIVAGMVGGTRVDVGTAGAAVLVGRVDVGTAGAAVLVGRVDVGTAGAAVLVGGESVDGKGVT